MYCRLDQESCQSQQGSRSWEEIIFMGESQIIFMGESQISTLPHWKYAQNPG